ncbi:MAG: hypothetical protein Q8S11_12250 [Daejeonella sp.]|nr:hypothetical protein [Daejeonella sp.]
MPFRTGMMLRASIGLHITFCVDPSIKGYFDRRIYTLGMMLVRRWCSWCHVLK